MSDEPYGLKAVLDHMPQSVAVYDRDARIVYLNPATEHLFGFTLQEAQGQRLWDRFPEAEGNPFFQAFTRVAAGGPVETLEHHYPPFDKWFVNTLSLVGEHVHIVAHDATDEVRRRRRLDATTRISSLFAADELGFDGALQAVAEVLTDLLGAACSVLLLSHDGAWLDLVASAAKDATSLLIMRQHSRCDAKTGHVGEALRTRSSVFVSHDVAAHESQVNLRAPQVQARHPQATKFVAPLLVQDQAIGVLIASRSEGKPALTNNDCALVTEIAPAVGLYIAHARQRRESESLRHRLETVADSNPALFSFVDPQERYQYVNASFERWFGRPRSTFIGQSVCEAVGQPAYDVLAARLRDALQGKGSRFLTELTYAFGHRHIDVSYQPIRRADGTIEGCAVAELDVTAQMQLEAQKQARAASEQRATRRLQSLLDVTVKLAAAASADEIARVVVDEGIEALDADSAGMWLLSPDGKRALMQRHRGWKQRLTEEFAEVPLDRFSPLSDCLGNGKPVWVKSRLHYQQRYPEHEKLHRAEHPVPLAFALLPLVIEGRPAGCVTFSFHNEQRLTADEQTYFEVLASHTAEALRRAQLYTQLRDVSETREAVIQASPAAIMLVDPQGIVQAWNPAAERIFGWSADEAQGRPLSELGLGLDSEFQDNLQKVLAGTSVDRRVTKRLRRNGDAFAVEMYAVPVQLSDGRTLCLSMVFDVSERARIEAGRRLVSKASALLTRSLDASQVLSEVVTLLAHDFSGWCAVEVRGPLGQTSLVQSERTSPQMPTGGECTVPLEVGERRVGTLTVGSHARAFDSLDLLIIADLAHHIATAIDNARLYEEARKARHEAEAASGAKDEFLAMLGHELRNPLAPISTALNLMRMRAPDQLERERSVIERQVEHLRLLVDDLLDISRITRGKVELSREHTLICEVVAKAIETTSPLLEQRQHRLVVDVPNTLAVVGDPMRLCQIVTNLVSNAAKYTDKGGQITVEGKLEGTAVVLCVRDNGIGMTPEMLPTIFDMFVQAPQSSARKSGGLGLGLAIVRTLVTMHGGTVVARSAGLGRGSEFSFTMPATPAHSLENAYTKKMTPKRLAARPKRVLVVDDNEDAAALLAELLTFNGHHVSTAFDGPSALDVAAALDPEVAVLDIGLPVMDGYELAERLRARQPGLRRLIALTGYGQPSDRERSAAAGFAVHIAKPVSVDQILRLLEEPV